MTTLLLVLSLLGGAPAPDAPERLDFSQLFGKVAVTGAEYSERARSLDGKRVLFRGHAVLAPRPEGALFLTRTPVERLHPDDEETLPWDTALVVWRKGLTLPKVPRQPTVEGTLRLGNRRVGSESVVLTLEDAFPYLEPREGAAP